MELWFTFADSPCDKNTWSLTKLVLAGATARLEPRDQHHWGAGNVPQDTALLSAKPSPTLLRKLHARGVISHIASPHPGREKAHTVADV